MISTKLPPRIQPLDEIIIAPEMAVVHLLDDALHTTRLALIAQHPTLACHDAYMHRDGPPTLRAARSLLRKSFHVHDAILRYSAAVHDAVTHNPNDDTLF
ncbi:MAG: hypothetical protein K8J08_03935 [Thermoanaerobaculia bacterium]|nr:hypothetical protein [Thermoanaerobaculia bacterium]